MLTLLTEREGESWLVTLHERNGRNGSSLLELAHGSGTTLAAAQVDCLLALSRLTKEAAGLLDGRGCLLRAFGVPM